MLKNKMAAYHSLMSIEHGYKFLKDMKLIFEPRVTGSLCITKILYNKSLLRNVFLA